MLENIDLSRRVSKEEYKAEKDTVALKLEALRREAQERQIPMIVVFEGWDAAGKGTLINDLILPMDARAFTVHPTRPPNEEERFRPFLWRFWNRIPPRGRITIYDRSWYRMVLEERVSGAVPESDLADVFNDIRSFERQLADDDYVLVKFFLHISRKEQRKRFDKRRRNPSTAWQVTDADLKRHRRYEKYLAVTEEMLAETDSDFAPWTVIEAHDRRFASLKILNTVIAALERGLRRAKSTRATESGLSSNGVDELPKNLHRSILDGVDLSLRYEREAYRTRLKRLQKRLRDLEHEIYVHRIPVVIVYQGWDAAGKGGNIKRLTQNLDPRGYEVIPIIAPNDIERAHHYLWRFWRKIPKAGHIGIFDRSWYGRVLVERVEGLCREAEWRRAYREINEMEKHLTNFGTILLKFWLHIDPEEQLARFEARERIEHKRWKINEEDWRNREKWDDYKTAVEEMLFRTSTPSAPWTIVESNCKWYARVKVLSAVKDAIEARIREMGKGGPGTDGA